jgi:RNA polymerase sigma factor (sigma-70 family)
MSDEYHLENTISRMLSDHDWRLTSFREVACDLQQFAARVRARLASWVEEEGHTTITPQLIERAIKHEYCRLLHKACNLRNTTAEERAMVELWRWIYPIVRSKIEREQDAEDVAQRALIKVWENCPQVRDPGAFLGYASMVTIREVSAFHKQAHRKAEFVVPVESREGETRGDEDDEYAASLAAYERVLRTGLANGLMLDESEQTILRWLEECIPRSAAQRLVIMEHVVRERSLAEVADLLNTPVDKVHLLKHRALKSLRSCVGLLQRLCQAVQPSRARKYLEERT